MMKRIALILNGQLRIPLQNNDNIIENLIT